jgi:hypothetical protein
MERPEDFRPNFTEKTLGWTGFFLLSPFLILTLPFVALLAWTGADPGGSPALKLTKQIVRPVAALLVFLVFLVVCIIALPYYLLLLPLMALGLVRKPPPSAPEENVTDGSGAAGSSVNRTESR